MDEAITETGCEMTNQERIELINRRIAALRPKLLDLTRRNPLISTRFSERSHSLVRIIDEVPSILLQSMLLDRVKVLALPELEIDPADENTPEFQSAFIEKKPRRS